MFTKTSNGDGILEQEGFDPSALFIMQGDFGLIQCAQPCTPHSVWDIKPFMEKGMQSFNPETYRIDDPAGVPKCPTCNGRMSTFLREDDTFLDSGVKEERDRYEKWLTRVMGQVHTNSKKLVILEVGAGFNTPIVLRIPDERIALHDGVQLVRVNPEYPEMPFQCKGVGSLTMRRARWTTSHIICISNSAVLVEPHKDMYTLIVHSVSRCLSASCSSYSRVHQCRLCMSLARVVLVVYVSF